MSTVTKNSSSGPPAPKKTFSWLKFFESCSIPSDIAQMYTEVFMDHHMKSDMLGDLTKEILQDLGIVSIGHILRIQKRAKALVEYQQKELTRERRLQVQQQANTYVNASKISQQQSKPITVSSNQPQQTPQQISLDEENHITARHATQSKQTQQCSQQKQIPAVRVKLIQEDSKQVVVKRAHDASATRITRPKQSPEELGKKAEEKPTKKRSIFDRIEIKEKQPPIKGRGGSNAKMDQYISSHEREGRTSSIVKRLSK
eukprot:gene6730-363_t